MTNYLSKIRYPIIIILTCLCMVSFADTLTVKQDGTGDYTIIQEAVNAAAFGDTVLVWPGIYYEHVKLTNRNICLASLTLTTGDNSYITQTIIDGNCIDTTWLHSCITLLDTVAHFEINGFTIQHGTGYYDASGGGLLLGYSNGIITNCLIQDNHTNGSAGGISTGGCTLFLSNVTIRNNHAKKSGGGITVGFDILEFDTINRCNIYGNYAANGTDIFKMFGDSVHFVLDTFTVLNPDRFYVSSINYPVGYQMNDITVELLNAKIEQTTDDLYVNPNGDNSNSGLSAGEPLKNIFYAYLKSKPDSLNHQYIHLSDGLYSLTNNEEWLPIGGRNYTNLIGSGKESCIIDAEYSNIHVYSPYINNISFQNMSLINGDGPYSYMFSLQTGSVFSNRNENVLLKNILFSNNNAPNVNSIRLLECNNITVEGCDIVDGIGRPVRIGTFGDEFGTDSLNFTNSHHYFINCRFERNLPNWRLEYGWNPFTASISTGVEIDTLSVELVNCLFADNVDSTIQPYYSRGCLSFNDVDADIVNCTFVNNTAINSQLGSSVNISLSSKVNVYNSIFYNNEPNEISLYDYESSVPRLNIYNSLVLGGEDEIINNGILYYDETNIDENPIFLGQWENPYQVNNGSPCINTGTLDLPDWIQLPETDLAGNPRIVGDSIDIGCYEWNPTVGIEQYEPIKEEKKKQLIVAPNPFSVSTTISIVYKTRCNVKLEIYNNYGQRVKVLFNGTTLPGTSQIIWYGDDDNGKSLPAGVYYVVMSIDGKESESLKVIFSD